MSMEIGNRKKECTQSKTAKIYEKDLFNAN